MRQISGLLILFIFAACGDKAQSKNIYPETTSDNLADTINSDDLTIFPEITSFDNSYEISKEHSPFLVTGYFNMDNFLDSAIIIRHKSKASDALFIKHGGTDQTFLIKDGNSIGADFDNFNWVGQFLVLKKGTKIWDNVIDGEIVGEDQVPENRKVTLQTDGIFVHVDEASGGGAIYFKNGKYVWIQQD